MFTRLQALFIHKKTRRSPLTTHEILDENFIPRCQFEQYKKEIVQRKIHYYIIVSCYVRCQLLN